MDDQSLELFNLISILKKVTKKQEILEDIKNLETEIIDLIIMVIIHIKYH